MATNDTTPLDGGSGSSTDDETLRLTIVALIVSLIALFLSTLQSILVFFQWDNSEATRKRCSEYVLGKGWSGLTEKRFKWRQLRYQVFFQVPVIYTAPPG
jgi:hypothetical protein